MAQQLEIANGFYRLRSLPMSCQECVNFIPHVPEAGGTWAGAPMVFGSPGIEQVAASEPYREFNRGAWVMDGVPYFVNDTTLYSLGSDFSKTDLGDISGSGRVTMADNGTQLFILVPGVAGYIYTVAGGLAEISDGDFTASGNPLHVVFIDGYFACTTDEKKWIISALNDGTTWSALDFSSAESNPDDVVRPVVVKNQIYIIGEVTTEGFQNIGGSGFPFQRTGVFMDKGTNAPFSVIPFAGTFFMIGAGPGEGPSVWMFTGNDYKRVSTYAIDNYLASLDDDTIKASYGGAYADSGGHYVWWSFTDTTLVYDMITGLWHERKSRIGDVDQCWRVSSMVRAYGDWLVGDTYDGRIGRLSHDIYGEYGNDILRTVVSQALNPAGETFSLTKIEVTVDSGVGNAAVPDPSIALSISRDGLTFSSDRTRKIGKVGHYNQRVIWRGIGLFNRVGFIRIRHTAQVKPTIIKMEVE